MNALWEHGFDSGASVYPRKGPQATIFLPGQSTDECCGSLVPLAGSCDAEFFVSSLDFEWTMVHTHEDYEIDGPYFIRREWVRANR
jgi:hypothetical protein